MWVRPHRAYLGPNIHSGLWSSPHTLMPVAYLPSIGCFTCSAHYSCQHTKTCVWLYKVNLYLSLSQYCSLNESRPSRVVEVEADGGG